MLSQKGSLELYDLSNDIGEKADLKERHPEIARRLQRTFAAWKEQMAPQIARVRRGRSSSGTGAPRKNDGSKR